MFGRRQNRKRSIGGAISRPKQLWLGYAIFVWFFLSPILAFEPQLHGAVCLIVGVFGLLMWIRGIAEMIMMYGTKTWRPPYGIAHDLLCIAVIVGLAITQRNAWSSFSALDRWGAAFVFFLVVSLGFETYYALAFYGAVEGKTTGEEGVWFADEHDPRFRRINLVTRIGNAILCLFQALFLAAALV